MAVFTLIMTVTLTSGATMVMPSSTFDTRVGCEYAAERIEARINDVEDSSHECVQTQ